MLCISSVSYLCVSHLFEWENGTVDLGRDVAVLTRLPSRLEAMGNWVLGGIDI